MPKYFPCFTDVEAHHILVFGGDAHALAKVKKLLAYAPCITVVSPAPCKELIALQKEGKINTVCRDLTECEEILDEFSPKLVFVTQADPPYDAAVFSACRARKIEINTEDKPRYCTFIFLRSSSAVHLPWQSVRAVPRLRWPKSCARSWRRACRMP